MEAERKRAGQIVGVEGQSSAERLLPITRVFSK